MGIQIQSLGYVVIEMQDPAIWLDVGVNVLGFTGQQDSNGTVKLKMDGAPFRYLVQPGETDRFVCAGWQCSSDEYDALLVALAEAGINYQEGSSEDCAIRQVNAFVSGVDPSGNSFEVFHGRDVDAAFNSPLQGCAFVADDLGMGHLVLPALEHAATSDFYQNILGFGMSDDLTLPPPMAEMPEMNIHFLHAANPRHHSLGLFNGPAPSGVVHLMAEYTTLDQVGACLDRVNQAGLPITATLGRHANDNMVSFYFLAPAGIPIEIGFDGAQFNWDEFEATQSTIGDIWGHEYNFPE
jgi:3,4-dihydroxy-9,10-secoandrosta-1,3,5(10)-triene-9,17-dione 4,5-dioxygenase